MQELKKKADVVADALAAMQQEEAAKEEALAEATCMQAALQRAQVRNAHLTAWHPLDGDPWI